MQPLQVQWLKECSRSVERLTLAVQRLAATNLRILQKLRAQAQIRDNATLNIEQQVTNTVHAHHADQQSPGTLHSDPQINTPAHGYPFHATWERVIQCPSFCKAMLSLRRLIQQQIRPLSGGERFGSCITKAERLHALGVGMRAKLARRLMIGVGYDKQRQTQQIAIIRRVSCGQAAALRNAVYSTAFMMCESGQFPAAMEPLELAVKWNDTRAFALLAHILSSGRLEIRGNVKNQDRAFELAAIGASVGCHDCTGMYALLIRRGVGAVTNRDDACLRMATSSSEKGSRYGQFVLAMIHKSGSCGLVQNRAESLALLRLSAAQGYDRAQFSLGLAYCNGSGVPLCINTALQLLLRAATQGYYEAGYKVAEVYLKRRCNGKREHVDDVIAAEYWYRRALEVDRDPDRIPQVFRHKDWYLSWQ